MLSALKLAVRIWRLFMFFHLKGIVLEFIAFFPVKASQRRLCNLLHIIGTLDVCMKEHQKVNFSLACPLKVYLNRHFILFLPNQRYPSGDGGCIFQMLDQPFSPLWSSSVGESAVVNADFSLLINATQNWIYLSFHLDIWVLYASIHSHPRVSQMLACLSRSKHLNLELFILAFVIIFVRPS